MMAGRLPRLSRASSARWRRNTAGELSNKVFIGQCRLIERGFRQGGAAGFGLRRVLLDERGEVKFLSGPSAPTFKRILVDGEVSYCSLMADVLLLFHAAHDQR